MTTAIGFDIGGTKISAAFIVGEEIEEERVIEYSRASFISDMTSLYLDLCNRFSKPEAVGVCCAGLVDSANGIVRFAGNLKLKDFPLREELRTSLGVGVQLENDAKSAVWGEYQFSKDKLGSNVAGLILGTGVGGALIVNGKLVHGKHGFAGEFGHIKVSNTNAICACGQMGCLETVASGTGLETDFFHQSGKELSAREIYQLAEKGDESALESFAKVGVAVGEVVAQLATTLDVDEILIGGGFGATLPLWQAVALKTAQNQVLGSGHRSLPGLVPAVLGNKAGLLGVARLALS